MVAMSVAVSSSVAGQLVFLAYAGLLFSAWGLGTWAAVDAHSRPDWAFERVETTRSLWMSICVGFGFILPPVGIVCSLLYLLKIRPRVRGISRCTECHQALPQYASFCPGCGVALDRPAAVYTRN
jgi:hypothetical protein